MDIQAAVQGAQTGKRVALNEHVGGFVGLRPGHPKTRGDVSPNIPDEADALSLRLLCRRHRTGCQVGWLNLVSNETVGLALAFGHVSRECTIRRAVPRVIPGDAASARHGVANHRTADRTAALDAHIDNASDVTVADHHPRGRLAFPRGTVARPEKPYPVSDRFDNPNVVNGAVSDAEEDNSVPSALRAMDGQVLNGNIAVPVGSAQRV